VKKMAKKFLVAIIAGLMLTAAAGSASAYEALYGPTEVTYYDKDKAYNGYTMFTHLGPGQEKYTYLIDMEGNLVHTWQVPGGIEKNTVLLENGNILRAISATDGSAPVYQEVDWDGNVVWEWKDSPEGYSGHHDFRKIFNKKLQEYTYMMIMGRPLTNEEALALGCDPALSNNYKSIPDGIIEVDKDGNIIWEWNISDHLVQDVKKDAPNYGVVKDHPEKMDPNFGVGRRGNWTHTNSIDYNPTLDHVVFNNSVDSEFYVIDHGATFIPGDFEKSKALAAGEKGDFLYRFGNPSVYDAADGPSIQAGGYQSTNGYQQMFFTHDIQWIDDGLPGEGNFLIFDNGARRVGETFSTILEICPYKSSWEDGVYVPEMEAGHLSTRGKAPETRSNQIVWNYKSQSTQSFYSGHISGAQRLPNGNTLICSGRWGHFFEVTPEGECVWEYISPVVGVDVTKLMGDMSPMGASNVFRAHRYGPDYPGLTGKDLTPKGPITEVFSNKLIDGPAVESSSGPSVEGARGAGGARGDAPSQ